MSLAVILHIYGDKECDMANLADLQARRPIFSSKNVSEVVIVLLQRTEHALNTSYRDNRQVLWYLQCHQEL